VNIFYASIRTTENCQFDKFRTAGMTGNAIKNSQGQGNNPVCQVCGTRFNSGANSGKFNLKRAGPM